MAHTPEILLDQDELSAVVERLGRELSERHDDGVVMIAVLRGGAARRSRPRMTIRTSVDFVALSPYTPGTGRVRLVMDVATNIEGKHVVIVEDIVDTVDVGVSHR